MSGQVKRNKFLSNFSLSFGLSDGFYVAANPGVITFGDLIITDEECAFDNRAIQIG